MSKPNTAREIEMFAIIERYLSSNLTQKQFALKEEIGYSTLQKWLRLYRESKESKPSQKTFIPIEVSSRQVVHENSCCIIEYPNGTIVRFQGQLDNQLIQSLLQDK